MEGTQPASPFWGLFLKIRMYIQKATKAMSTAYSWGGQSRSERTGDGFHCMSFSSVGIVYPVYVLLLK